MQNDKGTPTARVVGCLCLQGSAMRKFEATVTVHILGNTTDSMRLAGNLTEMILSGLIQESHNSRYGIDPNGRIPTVTGLELKVEKES